MALPGEGEVYAALLVGQRPGKGGAINLEDVERVAKLVEDVEQRTGVAPGHVARLRLAVLWARAKAYDRALPLFEEAVSLTRSDMVGCNWTRYDLIRQVISELLDIGKDSRGLVRYDLYHFGQHGRLRATLYIWWA